MADGIERMLVRWLDPQSGTDGQGIVISGGEFTVGDLPGGGSGNLILVDALPAPADYPDTVAVLRTMVPTMLGVDELHPNDAGMTYLADEYVASLAAAGVEDLTGKAVTAYGDSWTASDTENTAGKRAIVQMVDRLGGTLTNNGFNGYKAGDAAAWAIGTGATFTSGSADLVVVAIGLNDLQDVDTAQERAAVENYLRALFAVLVAAERIEQTAFTYTGTWESTDNTPLATSSGDSNAIASTDGAAASYTITTPGTYYLLLIGVDGTTIVGGTWTVTQAGTTLATIDGNAQSVDTGHLLTHGYGPLAVRLDDVAAGSLTITYSNDGRAGAKGFLDALIRVDDTPPTILAVKPVDVIASTHANPSLLAAIRDSYDTLAAEFGAHVVICDPEPGWAPDGILPELWYSTGASWRPLETLTAAAAAVDTTAEAERIRDVIAAALVEGANVAITVDDAGDTITIAATVPTRTGLVPVTTLDDSGNLVFVTTDDGSLVTVEV